MNSIRQRLTLAFIGLGLAPLLVAGLILAAQNVRAQRAQAIEFQAEIAQQAASEVSDWIHELENELYVTVNVQDLLTLDPDGQKLVLSRLQSYRNVFAELSLVDSQGQELARVSQYDAIGTVDLGDRSQESFFLETVQSGQPYFGLVQFDDETGEPSMVLAVPLVDARSGLVEGVLAAQVRVKAIWDVVAQVRVGDTGQAYIVGRTGDVIAHPNPSIVLRGTSFDLPAEDGIHTGLEGARVVLARASAPLGEESWTVVAERPVQEAMALTIRTVYVLVGVLLVALVAAGALALMSVRRIVSPLDDLAATAGAISGGDLGRRAEVDSDDELGHLARAFNAMTDQLQTTLEGLEAQRATEQQRREHLDATVQRYVEYMAAVGGGNLAARVDLIGIATTDDEPLLVLGQRLNAMTLSLQQAMVQIRDAALQISTAMSETVATASQQAATASEQAASTHQTGTTVLEVRTTAQQSAERANTVSQAAEASMLVAEQGLRSVQDTIAGMQSIKTQVAHIAQTILTLSEKTQQIRDITATVNELADQSNLLALNAAIEASHAGEAGKGFAVVADEVRDLANQSRQATAQVRTILGEIQKAANSAVMVTEEGTNRVESGVGLAQATGQAIENISQQIDQVALAARQIAASARQQLAGMDQISAAMDDIRLSTEQTDQGAAQVAETARGLNTLAEQLTVMVDRYQMTEDS